MSQDDYTRRSREAAAATIAKGVRDTANLRELLVWTTSTSTEPMVSQYLSGHLDDEQLLADLIAIALEGEDGGDAPWAAANVIAQFPAKLLVRHKSELEALAREQWIYLNRPAKAALAKLANS